MIFLILLLTTHVGRQITVLESEPRHFRVVGLLRATEICLFLFLQPDHSLGIA